MAGVQTSAQVPEGFEAQLEEHRRALTGYCYRMLGSSFEAEDAVQESFLRAWRNVDRFEGRSAFKSWLYKIATNVCLDMLDGRKRRARPMDLSAVGSPESHLTSSPEATWLEPIPDARVPPAAAHPAGRALAARGGRPGGARAGARDAAAGVRQRAAAPAGKAALGADPARGAAL